MVNERKFCLVVFLSFSIGLSMVSVLPCSVFSFSTCVPSCSQLKLARRWKPSKEETCKSRPVIDCFVTIFSVALYLFFFLYRFVYFVHVSVLPPSSCTLNNPNKQQPQQAKATTKNVGFLSLFCWAGNSWQQVKGSDEARAVKAKVFQ